MSSIDQLQHDHQRFRNALQTLEEALGAGETERLVPLCALLSERLRAHIRAEGQMAVWCSRVVGRFGPEVLLELAPESRAARASAGPLYGERR